MKNINIPLEEKQVRLLKAGDRVLLSGVVYTARDAAHKKIAQAIKRKEKLPINLKNAVIYYCGPTKTPKGRIIGSCGPTTSSRMDVFTAALLKKGLKGTIGKGRRSEDVRCAIKRHKAIYFIAPSGCGALLSNYVLSKKTIAYGDLGPEAIYELEIKDFPLIVAIDSKGGDVYAKK